jgi:similar to spore coat protein
LSRIQLAPHETFQIHELLQLKNNFALKIAGLTDSIADPKLKILLETDLRDSQQQIQELRDFLQASIEPNQ